jgi:hypothetical protein
MPATTSGATVRPTDVEHWLDELGLSPSDRADRDGVSSWDLRLDGVRRFDVPITLILDPAFALICWVHFAPPIGDGLRKSYRKLLRWNDEYPFVKFSLAEDGRPVLTTELPIEAVGRDALGIAIARSLAIADRLLEESASWLWIGGRIPDTSGRASRGAALLARYADAIEELRTPAEPAEEPPAEPAGGPTEDAHPVTDGPHLEATPR